MSFVIINLTLVALLTYGKIGFVIDSTYRRVLSLKLKGTATTHKCHPNSLETYPKSYKYLDPFFCAKTNNFIRSRHQNNACFHQHETPTAPSMISKDSSEVSSGVVAAPFLPDEEAHQFIRDKRQTNVMQGYWDPNSANNVWGITPAEQASEYWTSLRDSAQYYIGLSSVGFASDPSVVQEHIRSYMDYLRQTSVYLQQHPMHK